VVAQFVRVLALIEVPLEQVASRLGIEQVVGKSKPQGRILFRFFVRVLMVGKFAEVVDIHAVGWFS
jgi:hypothetical protein